MGVQLHHAEGRTDMKLKVAFRSFANALKRYVCLAMMLKITILRWNTRVGCDVIVKFSFGFVTYGFLGITRPSYVDLAVIHVGVVQLPWCLFTKEYDDVISGTLWPRSGKCRDRAGNQYQTHPGTCFPLPSPPQALIPYTCSCLTSCTKVPFGKVSL